MTTSITLRVFNFIKNRNPSQGKLRENCEKRFSQSASDDAKNPIKSRVFKKLHKQTKEVFKTASLWPLRYPSVNMMHSVHHIYGASERWLDELAHRIHFAFAKRIFAAGEISRNGAYYTYFIFSNSVHHIYGASKMWLDEFTHRIRSLRDAFSAYLSWSINHIRYFITSLASCQ